MIIDDLIFDRTQADVNRVGELKRKIMQGGLSALTDDEKEEYLGGLKGAYNYTDLNRVGQAVTLVAELAVEVKQILDTYRTSMAVAEDSINSVPYAVSDVVVSPRTDWAITDIPTRSQIERYLADIATLRSLITLPDNIPDAPTSLDKMTYITANSIEQILYVLYTTLERIETEATDVITRTPLGYIYSGEFYGGEV